MNPAMALAAFRVAPPSTGAVPIRSKMIFGPRPEATSDAQPEQAVIKVENHVEAPAEDAAPLPVPDRQAAPNFGPPPLSGGSGFGVPKIAAIAAGAVLAIAASVFLLKSTSATKAPAPAGPGIKVEAVGPSLISDNLGWNPNWNSSPSRPDQISVYRPSMTLANYRIQFQGQIENKSIGWIFRAADPKNYYVTRLQVLKPGLNPTVALVHFALINGEESQRLEKKLPFSVHADTVYKVRTDVLGTSFSTFVQDQLVDSWSDSRLKAGGFGLLGDGTDRSRLQLVQLFELRGGR
jgi:hypothetical protein